MDDDDFLKIAGIMLLIGIVATAAVIFVVVHFLIKAW